MIIWILLLFGLISSSIASNDIYRPIVKHEPGLYSDSVSSLGADFFMRNNWDDATVELGQRKPRQAGKLLQGPIGTTESTATSKITGGDGRTKKQTTTKKKFIHKTTANLGQTGETTEKDTSLSKSKAPVAQEDDGSATKPVSETMTVEESSLGTGTQPVASLGNTGLPTTSSKTPIERLILNENTVSADMSSTELIDTESSESGVTTEAPATEADPAGTTSELIITVEQSTTETASITIVQATDTTLPTRGSTAASTVAPSNADPEEGSSDSGTAATISSPSTPKVSTTPSIADTTAETVTTDPLDTPEPSTIAPATTNSPDATTTTNEASTVEPSSTSQTTLQPATATGPVATTKPGSTLTTEATTSPQSISTASSSPGTSDSTTAKITSVSNESTSSGESSTVTVDASFTTIGSTDQITTTEKNEADPTANKDKSTVQPFKHEEVQEKGNASVFWVLFIVSAIGLIVGIVGIICSIKKLKAAPSKKKNKGGKLKSEKTGGDTENGSGKTGKGGKEKPEKSRTGKKKSK